jgi:hypothetical protein
MSGEHTPPPKESIYTKYLAHRTLQEWYEHINTHRVSGDDLSGLRIIPNRYGRTHGEAAWWTIAAAVVIEHANGSIEEPDVTVENLFIGVVNDSPYAAAMVRDYLWVVPEDLQAKLDWEQVGWNE